VHKVVQEQQELKDPKGTPELKEQLVQEHKEQQEHRVEQDYKVHRVLKEIQEHKDL
jgi:type III secretory pathway component EscU